MYQAPCYDSYRMSTDPDQNGADSVIDRVQGKPTQHLDIPSVMVIFGIITAGIAILLVAITCGLMLFPAWPIEAERMEYLFFALIALISVACMFAFPLVLGRAEAKGTVRILGLPSWGSQPAGG
jgi:hypothetical protein